MPKPVTPIGIGTSAEPHRRLTCSVVADHTVTTSKTVFATRSIMPGAAFVVSVTMMKPRFDTPKGGM